MKVKGKTSGKWQNCEIVMPSPAMYRFRVTGACGEKTFDLTFEQLRQCVTVIESENDYERKIMKYFYADLDTFNLL